MPEQLLHMMYLMQSGIYEGGNISPGLAIRFKALNEFTGRLPLVSPEHKYDIVGRNTENAIRLVFSRD